MKRRDFVKTGGCGLAGLAILGILPSCSSLNHVQASMTENGLRVAKSSIGEAQFILVENTRLDRPILFNISTNPPQAISMTCTHLGCEILFRGSILECPCHGSEFDLNGNVLEGPAKRNLQVFNVSEDETNYYLST